MNTARPVILFVALVLAVAPLGAECIWWEAEAPVATNFPRQTWLSASTFEATRAEILSGGDWLTSAGKALARPVFARYSLRAAGGDYVFWTRKFWKHGPFRWRFDVGDWRTCGRDVGLADSTPIRQFVSVNWVCLGGVKLSSGAHTLEIELLGKPGDELTAAFDCFVLTTEPFVPRGRLKPGEKSGLADDGWWAFEPPADPFGKAELDLRALNEKTAGESGFVRRAGGAFALGSGKPVRFWAVNVGGDVVRLGDAPHRYLARRLAKVGVNMVRIHSALFDANAADPAAVDAAYLGQLHHLVASLKAEGIYVMLSFYFPVWFDVKPGYGIPGYDGAGNKKPFALLMFDPRMQGIYHSWARGLLTTKNPCTGLPLGQDPAVAIVEILNEDSYLFWTFSEKNIPREQMQKLETLFGAWLSKRYGTLDRALAAWEAKTRPTDAPKDGRMALLDAWFMTSDGVAKSGLKARASDQLRFLVESQRAFYDDTIRFFRKDLGLKSLVSCSNWQTADPTMLDALERYTYAAGDVIDRHGYFGGAHTGPRSGYALDPGDTFADRAGVLEPWALPIHVNQVEGHPHVISEIGWPNPNRYKAEFPFLAAACGSTTGLNGIFFFAVGDAGWESGARKFAAACPTIIGQFPAVALMYRRGDLKEAPVVVHESLRLDDLFAFKGSAAVTPQNLDELRRSDVPPGGESRGKRVASIDPLAFCVGVVERSFDKTASTARARDLGPFVDRNAKTLRSATGELAWDWGKGFATVNSPRTQGATGFLSRAGRIDLAAVVIESRNEFGTVVVTALDDKPLASSSRILIQAMTEEKPYGWKVVGDKIAAVGGYPLNVRNVDAAVTLKGRTPTSVTILDEHGYRRHAMPPSQRIVLPPDALYLIVE